jgi:hypothetical protein
MTDDFDPTKNYTVLTLDEINKKIQNDGDRERAKRIMDTNKQLSDRLVHYQKLATRWTRINILLRVLGHGLAFISMVLVTVFSSYKKLNIPVEVDIFLGIFSAADSSLTEMVCRFFTSKRKVYYLSKITEIQTMINRAYYYINKAVEDSTITIDEMDNFTKLITDNITKLKQEDATEKQNEKDDFIESLKKIANDLALSEFKNAKIKELKKAEVQRLRQQYTPASTSPSPSTSSSTP